MPLVPHYPSDERDGEDAPNIDDVVDRIINGGRDPSPTVRG
jgi:hypothetical protein